jgi:drug/metabolite transporter (DMT)-like permease
VTAAVILTRTAGPVHGRGSRAIVLLAAVAALTLAGHALAGALGIDLFNERYLTVMIPLVAALGATAILGLRSRRPAAVAAVALAILGVIGAARRYGTQFEPSLAPAAAAALAADPATVLTNTPVVVYYLRGLHPVLDRPYNLGPGRAAACARPCVVVDDTRVPGGTPRRVTGRPILISPFIVTVER